MQPIQILLVQGNLFVHTKWLKREEMLTNYKHAKFQPAMIVIHIIYKKVNEMYGIWEIVCSATKMDIQFKSI